MRSVFISQDGKNVVRLRDRHFGPNDVGLIEFTELTDASASLAVTDLRDKMNPRYQIVDTLGDRTLLNTFGRSMDSRVISGLVYENICGTDQDASGYEDLMSFFNRFNAVVRDTPVTITVGKNFARRCYLLEMGISLADPVARIWQFDAQLIVDPGVEFAGAQGPIPEDTPPGQGGDETLSLAANTLSGPQVDYSSGWRTAVNNSLTAGFGTVSRSGDPLLTDPVASPSTTGQNNLINPFVV